MKVLFLGNSHTFVHYVPARAARFCQDQGRPLEAVMLTHPGVGLGWHLEQSQTYFNLLCGGYDAVVLQHNAHPFPGRESLLSDGEHSSVLGASLAGAVIGRALLGLEITPAQCYQDAKVLAQLALDPRMIDMVLRDGHPAMEAIGP